jgi:WD40 repeat protein
LFTFIETIKIDAMKKILFLTAFSLILSNTIYSQEFNLEENKEFKNLSDYVLKAEFSPFRNYYAYSIGNNTLRIFDKNWEKLFEHQGNPESRAGSFAFSPDGEYLAYAKYKGETDIAIIRLSDQKVVQVLDRHGGHVYDLRFSHDGKFLSSVGIDYTMILWKREGEQFSYQKTYDGFKSYLNECSFSHDDRFLVTGDNYGYIKVYERKDGTYNVFQEFQYRSHSVSSVVFHPKRNEFITGSSYGLRRYKLQKNLFVFTDSVAENAYVKNTMAFSPQGEYLAIPHYTQINLYKVYPDSLHLHHVNHRHAEYAFGASFSEDGKFMSTYGADKQIIIWELNDVEPSDKALVSSWLIGNLSVAQRRSLTPAVSSKIIQATNSKMAEPRDEFEKTSEYNERMDELSDHTLGILQLEMEKLYDAKGGVKYIEVPVTELVGYNADLEIYKIRFLDTEAGVRIPVEDAKKLKKNWKSAKVKINKSVPDGKTSREYEDFILVQAGMEKSFEVIPVENPFKQSEPGKRSAVVSEASANPSQSNDTLNGTTYALLLATNVYDYFGDLINPVLDAQTIAAELEENYGVIAEVLVNPSLVESAAKLREFATKSYGEKDNLMVFIAGHGIYDEVFREGYVISRDSKSDDLGKTSYLSHSNLRTMINHINCPHIFLVMDVCFGGTFDPHLASTHRGSSQYADISTQAFVERKLKYTTRLYLTSGGKEYVPDGRPGFHSPFARRFIESLRYYGGEDGVLTTAEILQFVEKTDPQPRFGEFGDNEPGSDFIFVSKGEG